MIDERPPPAPWHFRLARRLIRLGVRGPGVWLRLARRCGWLPPVARLPLDAGLSVDLPLERTEYWWDAAELRQYEHALLDLIAERAVRMARPLTLVDCGADIGLFPLLLAWRGVRCERLVAIEPNPRSAELLASNLRQLEVAHEVHVAAVGAAAGRGRLAQPATDASCHAAYLVPDENGDVRVLSIDSLDLPVDGSLLLKLDVEGGELAALQGAQQTLCRAGQVLAAIEAHRDVSSRTLIEPLECVRFLQSLRPCRAQLAERPEIPLDGTRPLFEQVPDLRIGNLVLAAEVRAFGSRREG